MKLLAAVLGVAAALPAQALPSFAEVRAAHRSSDVDVLDRHGIVLQTVRVEDKVRRLAWVPLADVSPALRTALVLSEDRRFWEHSGVDWGAVAGSAWANLWNTRTRGASTLTMQLAGLLDADLARPSTGRSLTQKLGQVVTAGQLEARWKKSEILEAYLNEVTWRGETVGIAALSQTLFGKFASGLDANEAAIASALLRGPNAVPSVVAQRACGVLQAQKLSCVGVEAMASNALARQGGAQLGEQVAPHFARQWLRVARPVDGVVRTTLDARLQRFANQALRAQLRELAGREVEDGALVVLDNASGEVRAWVGSSGAALSGAAQVDGVLARRQPGSTLKPFVYELAFERRLLTPASLIDDAPTQISTAGGLYTPQNYDRDFKGLVSARAALGNSLNIPAVRVGAMLGPDALFERLNRFGLALPQTGGWYGASLALGSADVTLLALTNAYRALANGGMFSEVALPAASHAKRRVAEAAPVWLVTDILADNEARARTFGLDSVLATRGFAAVKTGTSKDMRDNWALGFSDRYTIGVWVGNASGAPMQSVSGVSGAAPVWQQLALRLHEGSPSKRPAPPPGLVEKEVAFDGHEPKRCEWFIAGTEARVKGASNGAFGIVSPRDGSIFALDPDIPPAAQRIVFEGESGSWWLDGRRLGQGTRLHWSPWPGRHVLALKDREGQALQSIAFEVRGASAIRKR